MPDRSQTQPGVFPFMNILRCPPLPALAKLSVRAFISASTAFLAPGSGTAAWPAPGCREDLGFIPRQENPCSGWGINYFLLF